MTGLIGSVEVGGLPPPVLAFITQLGIALHKTRAYPPGHPMRDQAIAIVQQAMHEALGDRPSLRIVVARRQLVVDGAGSDPDHFIIRDLATKLSRLQVGVLVFHRGVAPEDLTALVEYLAAESAKTPVARASITPWARDAVEVVPLSFDALALDTGTRGRVDAEKAADRLWQELASRMLAGDVSDRDWGARGTARRGPGGPNPAPDPAGTSSDVDSEVAQILGAGPSALAEALAERVQRPELRQRLATTLERMARAAPTLEPGERKVVEVRLRHLLASLSPESLQALLDLDLHEREDLTRLATATEWLPVPALLDLIEDAAATQQQGLSNYLLRLVRKLERNADADIDMFAGGEDLRSTLRTLLENWTLASPNPWHHTRILDALTACERGAATAVGEPTASEGLRLVLMALETGVVGPQVIEGLEIATEAGDLGLVLQALDEAPPDSDAAGSIWEALIEPAALRHYVILERIDGLQLKRLVARIGPEGIDQLLDLVVEAPNFNLQRALLERVVEFGTLAADHLNRRLSTMDVDKLRSVLRLLAEMPELPDGLSPGAHTRSAEPMVRLEAYRVVLRNPAERVEAMYAAFNDPDERVVRVAVDAALAGFPDAGLARLMLLLGSPSRSLALRARAVPILRQFRSAAVLRWLTDRMTVRKGLFRRLRLVPKTPVVVARVRVLAEVWADAPEAQRVLRLAASSSDRELVAAATAAPEPSE